MRIRRFRYLMTAVLLPCFLCSTLLSAGCTKQGFRREWIIEGYDETLEDVSCGDVQPYTTTRRLVQIDSADVYFPFVQVAVTRTEETSEYGCQQKVVVTNETEITKEIRMRKKDAGWFVAGGIFALGFVGVAIMSSQFSSPMTDHERKIATYYTIGWLSLSALAALGALIWSEEAEQGYGETVIRSWESGHRRGAPKVGEVVAARAGEPTKRSRDLIGPAAFETLRASSEAFLMSMTAAEGHDISGLTDAAGRATIRIEGTPENWLRATDGADIERRIASMPLMGTLKGFAKSRILADLDRHGFADCLSESNQRIVVSTANDTAEVVVHGYEINDLCVLEPLSRFIDDEVNSRIANVLITLKDIDTHIPIELATAAVRPNAPSPRAVLSQYFEGGPLLEYALERVRPYDHSPKDGKTNSAGQTQLTVLLGEPYEIEFTHGQYNYHSEIFIFEPAALTRTIEMSQVGTMHRVRVLDH